MTISPSFNPKLIPNSAINLLFDIVRTYKTDSEGILVPCIICLINLTTMGYDVIYSFSKKGLIHLLYEIIKVFFYSRENLSNPPNRIKILMQMLFQVQLLLLQI